MGDHPELIAMHPGACAEWHPLRHVMVHEPGIEVFFALLSPAAHLYERFFSLEEARREHRALVRTLAADFGVGVTALRDAVCSGAETDPRIRETLVELALQRTGSRCQGAACDLSGRIRTAYDRPLPLAERDPDHLFEIVRLNPEILFTTEGIRTLLGRPLHNLYFMRDQQITTPRGIMQARMAKAERADEVALAGLGLRAAGALPVHRIGRGSLEGGDYIPAGDFHLVGCGARTTPEGIADLLAAGPGAGEVAVVHQPRHPLVRGRDPMINMHLDTYLGIAGEGIAFGNPALLGAARVEIFEEAGDGYLPAAGPATLEAYLAEKGFSILPITTLEQLCYATNFLCIESGVCITPDTATIAPAVLERLAEKARANPEKYGGLLAQAEHDYRQLATDHHFFPHAPVVAEYGLDMPQVTLTNATGGYGGAHCMTCALKRG